MSKLLDKIRKNTIVDAQILQNSRYFLSSDNEAYPTRVPILNLASTGSFKNGGLLKGITMLAAPPQHFKTSVMIEGMFAFQEGCKTEKIEDYYIVFYDSEKGATVKFFENAGIDTSKIDHRFVTSVEQLRSDIANLLNDIEIGDKIMICIDSLGMLPSLKEVADALSESDKADMTRAKIIKSLIRIITPHVNIKGIPVIIVNHSYQSMELFPKEIVSGGRGAQYAGHTVWTITKAQEKEGDELAGFRFTINAHKSRYVKEYAKFPITVLFATGIQKYSGIFDLALEYGYITSPKKGFYARKGIEESKRRASLEDDEVFMESLLDNKEFTDEVENNYKL